jgi:hypothetical protein
VLAAAVVPVIIAACSRPLVRHLGPIGDDPGVAQLLWEIIADRMQMVHP